MTDLQAQQLLREISSPLAEDRPAGLVDCRQPPREVQGSGDPPPSIQHSTTHTQLHPKCTWPGPGVEYAQEGLVERGSISDSGKVIIPAR